MRAVYLFGLFTLLLLYTSTAFAQKKDGGEKKKKDPEYVEKIDYKFSLHPFYLNQSAMLGVKSKLSDTDKFIYRPNILGAFTIAASYSFLSLSYSFPLKLNAMSEENYGKSDFSRVGMTIRTRSVVFDLYYMKYGGFYLDEKYSYYPHINADSAYYQRPDLETFTIGYSNHFVFSRKFSLKAAFDQTERQKKSTWAMMMLIGDRYTRVQADSSIIPATMASAYPDLEGFHKGSFNSLILAPGVGFTLVAGNFSLTPYALIGTSMQLQSYKIRKVDQSVSRPVRNIKFSKFFSFKAAVGYNADNFFVRLVYGIDVNTIPIRKTSEMKLSYFVGEAKLGVRF